MSFLNRLVSNPPGAIGAVGHAGNLCGRPADRRRRAGDCAMEV